jgi:hypothetical protein
VVFIANIERVQIIRCDVFTKLVIDRIAHTEHMMIAISNSRFNVPTQDAVKTLRNVPSVYCRTVSHNKTEIDMTKTPRAILLASALLFSMGAIAQTGGTGGASGSGSPTQGMEKDADKAHAHDGKTHKDHKDQTKRSNKSTSSTGSTAPNMQVTPDGKTPTPDATLPAGK